MIKRENIGAIRTTNIKGREYAEVNSRVMAFWEACPNGEIATEIIKLDDTMCVMKTTVLDDEGKVIATGHAFEYRNSNSINKTSYIENCETSSVGRALGFAGIGINGSICSAEELSQAVEQQEAYKEASDTKARLREAKKLLNDVVIQLAKESKMDPNVYTDEYLRSRDDWNPMDAAYMENLAKELMGS